MFEETHCADGSPSSTGVGWVNRLLQWRRAGYRDETPFGPGSKAVRERRKPVQATEQRAPRKADADLRVASAERRKREYPKQEAEPETTTSTATNPLAGFKSAVDYWFPQMDYAARCEAVSYVLNKPGVRVS
jgi:hypothetical protein